MHHRVRQRFHWILLASGFLDGLQAGLIGFYVTGWSLENLTGMIAQGFDIQMLTGTDAAGENFPFTKNWLGFGNDKIGASVVSRYVPEICS